VDDVALLAALLNVDQHGLIDELEMYNEVVLGHEKDPFGKSSFPPGVYGFCVWVLCVGACVCVCKVVIECGCGVGACDCDCARALLCSTGTFEEASAVKDKTF